MTDTEDDMAETEAVPPGVGPQLRAARERKGLTIDQVASETRISRRHLEEIEEGNFSALPGRTYAIGFARTFARTVDLDQEDVVAMVRAEMDASPIGQVDDPASRRSFEPGDPARAPGGGLLWFSLIAVAILLVGIFFAARALFAPAAELPSLVEQQEQEQAAALAEQQAAEQEAAEPIDASGEVVFTAEGETWVRFYDGNGRVLREGMMREGESFTVPADAVEPQIITGRPDRLAITIGGRPVRKLSTEVETIQDVPISAAALLGRTGGAATIGFGGGTPSAEDGAPTATATQAASPPQPRPTATATATSTPATQPTPRPTPTATPTQARPPAAPATATPSPAATAPPRAEPAETDPDEPQVAAEPS
ncbi:helix-turn-helix domain-containing protein [Aurantiacibacter sp. MUD11]|uniref:helix-turn-helix domain-containing protein n=1 Tax=Aurantiacibacter sp. MUD11 TaxID=3003265 RepID=UPI0022AB0994|nr:helix-turn-helix domain-containing protein [Aurantiacibacter sp. MUD11]WAT19197.1 helix-turn-helix domain-containing protein [Aurantiacibacter sp. MUD11]